MSKDWIGNRNSVYKTLGATSHTKESREEDDFYATDPDAIDKLLTVETPKKKIWECAAGAGHLAKRLRNFGYEVYATDIKNRGYEHLYNQNFLEADRLPFDDGCDILTNPPYKYAKEFVIKALELLHVGDRCYMFLKLQFLEGIARYEEIFRQTPPKDVYVFRKRILCAKNGEFERMKLGGGSAVAYAWFVWEKGYEGTTTLSWI